MSGAGGLGAESLDNLPLTPAPEPVANTSRGVEGAAKLPTPLMMATEATTRPAATPRGGSVMAAKPPAHLKEVAKSTERPVTSSRTKDKKRSSFIRRCGAEGAVKPTSP